MFKIQIKKQNTITNESIFKSEQEATSWLESEKNKNSFGKLAGEYELDSLSESELASELSRKNVLDMSGIETDKILVTIPDQFQVITEDITVKMNAQKESDEALAYLLKTDYLALRKADTGLDIPQDIKDARAAARLKVIK